MFLRRRAGPNGLNTGGKGTFPQLNHSTRLAARARDEKPPAVGVHDGGVRLWLLGEGLGLRLGLGRVGAHVGKEVGGWGTHREGVAVHAGTVETDSSTGL